MEYIKTKPELYHHGIKGQKWGVKNGPPYPLSSGQKSSSEKRTGSVTKKKPSIKEVVKTTAKVYKDEGKKFFKDPKDNFKRAVSHPIKESIPYQVKDRLSGKTGGMYTKPANAMTNKELQEFNSRRKLEDTYNKYTSPSSSKPAWNAASQIANQAANNQNNLEREINNAFEAEHKRKKQEIDLSHMSDDELRKAVNRMNLEQQYRNLLPADVSKGEQAVKEALSIIGPLVGTAASIIGIIAVVKNAM